MIRNEIEHWRVILYSRRTPLDRLQKISIALQLFGVALNVFFFCASPNWISPFGTISVVGLLYWNVRMSLTNNVHLAASMDYMKYFDRQGNEISKEEYVKLFEDMEYRRIGLTDTPRGEISTVWLGINHSSGQGKPLIFETLCPDQHMDRYSTEEEAREGHRRYVLRYGGEGRMGQCPGCGEEKPISAYDYVCHDCRATMAE